MRKIINLIALFLLLTTTTTAGAVTIVPVSQAFVWYKTTQEGTYQHKFINGYIKGTTKATYGTCTVCCEKEYYKLTYSNPDLTSDEQRIIAYDCHGACGLGDIRTN